MCHYDNININNCTAGIDPLTPGTGVIDLYFGRSRRLQNLAIIIKIGYLH